MNCLICNQLLDPLFHDVGTHPGCDEQQAANDELALALKKELTEIILWANAHSPRSLQQSIGPSELGTPCDRRLAYRLAGHPEINLRRDPWPAIVGTGVHAWLEDAVTSYQNEMFSRPVYLTEQELDIDPLVLGHTDLYRDGVVIDYKTAGPDVMKKMRDVGPPTGYKVQTQLYGLGHTRAGRRVDNVALVFLPRAGWLSGMYVWTDQYRPDVAQRALDRMYSIAEGLLAVDIANNPEVYDRIPAIEDHCGYCPFYKRAGLLDMGADEKGCPGV